MTGPWRSFETAPRKMFKTGLGGWFMTGPWRRFRAGPCVLRHNQDEVCNGTRRRFRPGPWREFSFIPGGGS